MSSSAETGPRGSADDPLLPETSGHGQEAELARLLDSANSQLALYARDLKRTVDIERGRARELAEANARLQIVDRLKRDFLMFIAHELRTPLTWMSAVQLLDEAADPQQQRDLLDSARQGYVRLESFIRNALEYFNWLGAERVEQTNYVDLAAVARRAVAALPDLHAPWMDLRLETGSESCPIHGDEAACERMMGILLENALKFSPADKRIRVKLERDGNTCRFAVTDEGRGFAPSIANELFHPFTVADVMRHGGGSGLSLAMASLMVKAHGGTIRAASAGVGQGATFTVEIPVAHHEPEHSATVPT